MANDGKGTQRRIIADPQKNKQTVLVAGATGILGREVARLLHEEGYRVKTFSRNPARAQALKGIADEITTGDATNQRVSAASLTGPMPSSHASALP